MFNLVLKQLVLLVFPWLLFATFLFMSTFYSAVANQLITNCIKNINPFWNIKVADFTMYCLVLLLVICRIENIRLLKINFITGCKYFFITLLLELSFAFVFLMFFSVLAFLSLS